MLKRLIEVALPLKEVSEQSAHDNRIRSGHIRTIHIWWARRPLAACRAVVFASLIPDADDPECPEEFRRLVMEVLGRAEFKPEALEPSPSAPVPVGAASLEDTPRNRCLEFIKHLVRWENSNNPEYIEPARKLIAAAHKILHPDAERDAPKVLDPFAGGGAIPLEALRLGTEAHAVELNPVAHIIELCTLVYPQKYGQPGSRSVPDYIERLIVRNRAKSRGQQSEFFDSGGDGEDSAEEEEQIVPEVTITEEEYRKNPLAADVKYWGHWVHARLSDSLGDCYFDTASSDVPLAFLWARTVQCSNPSCRATVPLFRQLWLCNKRNRKIAIRPHFDVSTRCSTFAVVEGDSIDFDPSYGTLSNGKVLCPFCSTVSDGTYLRQEATAGRMGRMMTAVVLAEGRRSKRYRPASSEDIERCNRAEAHFENVVDRVPTEPIPRDRPSPNSRGLSAISRYGFTSFGQMFSPRQAVCLITLQQHIRDCYNELCARHRDENYARAVATYLAFAMDKIADFGTTCCRWGNDDEGVTGTFGRQAVPMVWDYAETNPLVNKTGGYTWAIDLVLGALRHCADTSPTPANVERGAANRLPFGDEVIDSVVVDPPYYDSVPYGDLSDFFYVWLKQTLGDWYSGLFQTPLTPKREETIAYWGNTKKQGRAVQKRPEWYEEQIGEAFSEMFRSLHKSGICPIMFAHKTTTAWESIVLALTRSGLYCTASWPIHTEGRGRLTSQNAAALASSITLVCRKRTQSAGMGLWDDVRRELAEIANDRLDFFWEQGIRGADFFVSAIGPALSVFGKYEKVTRLDGEAVSVGQFLDEVRALVTDYALTKILQTTQTATIDPETRFYVVWKWSYGDAKVPADESFKLAQALGIDTEMMWDRTGVLNKSGENVQAISVNKRMKIKDLGEPTSDGTPASLIDVLHRLCAFREEQDTTGMAEFLAKSGHGQNPTLWLVAQAVSEILPEGEKEKQLMQGLLNQQEQLQEAGREARLF